MGAFALLEPVTEALRLMGDGGLRIVDGWFLRALKNYFTLSWSEISGLFQKSHF